MLKSDRSLNPNVLKLVKQVKLFFQEGSSDKVYEIDLCESGDGFLVNFRYGRRGAALKEGTKTVFPVPLSEAEKVFGALEEEKRKKGYVAAGEAPIVTAVEPKASKSGSDKRKKTIVKLLKAAAAGEIPEHWQLSRIIWRAGDLKITEAIPYIIQVADPVDAANIYSAVWAIGRCGTSQSTGFLQNLQQNKNLPEHLQELIFDVLLKVSGGKEKEALEQLVLESLPSPLRKCILDNNLKQLEREIRNYLFELKTAGNEYLVALYRLSFNNVPLREILQRTLEDVPLKVNYFKYARKILKTADMLEDFDTAGVILKQIEKQPAAYKVSYWTTPEQKKTMAFSDKTKLYLTRRSVRQLRKYGEAQESTYTAMATSVLLAFTDAKDQAEPWFTSQYVYTYDQATRSYSSFVKRTDYDAYSKFHAFNYILYKNSGRYKFARLYWACVPPYLPGKPSPAEREEAFPHLWNSDPKSIIRLLSNSKVARVHEFALKVWRANSSFAEIVVTENIVRFLSAPFAETQNLGLTLAQKKFDRQSPDKTLLTAMLDSALPAAVDQAIKWIAELRATLLTDTEFLVSLFKMRSVEGHAWLRSTLSTTTLSPDQAQVVIGKMVSFFTTYDVVNEDDEKYLLQIGDTLILSFSDQLRHISLEVIKDLFRHPAPIIHAFAGKILLKHEISADNLPEDLLQILLLSNNVHSRGMGIALLGKFPEQKLLERKDILVSFCLSPLADVRNAVKPIILKLSQAYPAFGRELVELFVPAFLIKESYEGVHDDLLGLLANELAGSLHIVSKERTLTLLNSRFRNSQLIGSVILAKHIPEDSLTVAELVKLGSNALLEVRVKVWEIFNRSIDKIKALKEEALKLTDTNWDDSRIFAFDYFRRTFTASDWNTELLVMLCDSTKEDVQAFAREMITRFFEVQQGSEYLLKLSQHPSTKVQLFTTSYLEQYAQDRPSVIETLKPYFITLLSQVNKGKVAKRRVFDFLRRQAMKDESVARIAAEIFTRVSVSVAITERAECIAALRDIRKNFSTIESPVIMRSYSDYVKQ